MIKKGDFMNIILKTGIIEYLGNITNFYIKVNENNFYLILKRMEIEKSDCLTILKTLKLNGKIKSISIPRTKDYELQIHINELMELKKLLSKNIKKIKEIYSK